MKGFLSPEEKRAIVVEYYGRCYRIVIRPDLPEEAIEDYYNKIFLLAESERKHKEKAKARNTSLKLVI